MGSVTNVLLLTVLGIILVPFTSIHSSTPTTGPAHIIRADSIEGISFGGHNLETPDLSIQIAKPGPGISRELSDSQIRRADAWREKVWARQWI